MVCHHCTIDGDDAEPWGDTTASTVKPTTQTEEEEAEQQDTELTQAIQQQCPSGEQAAEPSEKRYGSSGSIVESQPCGTE